MRWVSRAFVTLAFSLLTGVAMCLGLACYSGGVRGACHHRTGSLVHGGRKRDLCSRRVGNGDAILGGGVAGKVLWCLLRVG